jgi:hypothetical protein
MLSAEMRRETAGGVRYDTEELDACERDFWGDVWDSVPAELAREKGVERREFGPIRASIAREVPQVGMLNLVLGAAAPGAVEDGHLAAATEWAESHGVHYYVPVTPGLPDSEAAERWLQANGYSKGRGWMKFVRGPHPPRFKAPAVEVVELTDSELAPFGMIVATSFELPAWAAAFFADLPGHEGWRCYGVRVEGEVQACAGMHVHAGIAEFGPAATLEPARGRGCQLALLHRRILDAIDAGCHTFWVETGIDLGADPGASYRNILRAGFEEAYLRPNWRQGS